MTPDTPPPNTYDLKAAYDWREGMIERADGMLNGCSAWHGWAIVESFMAGMRYAESQKKKKEE